MGVVNSGRTLWEEGRQPGRQVVTLAVVGVLVVVVLDVLLTGQTTLFFDLAFVTTCVAAGLSVRRRDFFAVGVLPPLLMFGTVLILAVVARGAVADEVDGLIQAVVTGLAHHAGSLVCGYALTLGVLALRQQAIRNSGLLRADHRGSTRQRPASGLGLLGDPHVPAQLGWEREDQRLLRGVDSGGIRVAPLGQQGQDALDEILGN